MLFVDEAEYTWPQFLRDYAAGAWQAEYRQDEKPDLPDSPLPRFDLLKVDRYRSMTIQFARGCPFNCEFCDIIVMYGRRPRDEVGRPGDGRGRRESIASASRNVFVVDDNFIGNKKDAKELLRGASPSGSDAHGYPIEFITEVSAQRRAGRRAAAPAARGALHHDLHRHRVAARGEPRRRRNKTQNMREDLVDGRAPHPGRRHPGAWPA